MTTSSSAIAMAERPRCSLG